MLGGGEEARKQVLPGTWEHYSTVHDSLSHRAIVKFCKTLYRKEVFSSFFLYLLIVLFYL